ncbi:MAG: hypothetical protein COB67_02920, partial [SAR324 cluster bacterium]
MNPTESNQTLETPTDIDWQAESEKLETKQQELFDRLVRLLRRFDQLQTVNLSQLLKKVEQKKETGDKFAQSIKRIIDQYGEIFPQALTAAGLENPIPTFAFKTEHTVESAKAAAEEAGQSQSIEHQSQDTADESINS